MYLADHGIATNTAKPLRNLRGAETRAPELVERGDAIISPCHEYLQK
jgi:hypothetical protein